jgi:DNA-binding MarR family transcriptional regulator
MVPRRLPDPVQRRLPTPFRAHRGRYEFSLSRLSHVISRIERHGWVRRVSKNGGRATNAELTDEGLRKLREAGPIHFQEVRRLVFDVLTPDEVKDLRRLTSRLNPGLLPETDLGPLGRRTRARALRDAPS